MKPRFCQASTFKPFLFQKKNYDKLTSEMILENFAKSLFIFCSIQSIVQWGLIFTI
jgi:hypothetical protein